MVFGQEQYKSMHEDNVPGKFFKGYTDLVLPVALYSNKQYVMDLHNIYKAKSIDSLAVLILYNNIMRIALFRVSYM